MLIRTLCEHIFSEVKSGFILLIVWIVVKKGGYIIDDGLKITFCLFELPCLLIETGLVIKRGDNKFPFNGLATTGSILKHLLGLIEINERFSILLVPDTDTSISIEFL